MRAVRVDGAGARFLDETGTGGYGQWVQGRLERGPLGGARRLGKPKWEIHAYRCEQCGHLELFANEPV